jgi:predicted short-subunit dehydrogenase-like oxidoreductase (DUF2520 family)
LPRPEFNIVIIGSGNMAHALGKLFSPKHTITQIISRNKKTGTALAKKLKTVYHHSLNEINTQADFYFLCVPDDKINKVSKKIKHLTGTIVHHSGSKPMEEIDTELSKAVIYPFISINTETILNKKEIPIFYQSNNKATDFLLKELLAGYKLKAQPTTDKNRAQLHVAGVLVNNFTNHLYYQANNLVKEIPEANKLLVNLAEQAISNFKKRKTKENQTGPARRKDKTTQTNHLSLIKKNKELTKIYLSLSESITKTYNA